LEKLMVSLMSEPVTHRVVVVMLWTVSLLFSNLHFDISQQVVEMLRVFLQLSRIAACVSSHPRVLKVTFATAVEFVYLAIHRRNLLLVSLAPE
jgi:hypothetical protein